ncbi:16423_t:CDS:2, partial [Gigaspora margarita]
ASLSNIKSYFKNFDQTNISEAFDATKTNQEVITNKDWTAFTKKFYNLQVKSQSGYKSLIKYLDKEENKNILENKPTAFQSFKYLADKELQNAISTEKIQIYSIAMYYITLCYLNLNDKKRALEVLKN